MSGRSSIMSGNAVRVAVMLAGLWVTTGAHAALFEDDEARKAILELRQRVEADTNHVGWRGAENARNAE